MRHPFLILILLFIATSPTWAQEHDHSHHGHEAHKHGEHAHDVKNEIALALGPSYSFEEEEWATALHFHYIRKLRHNSKVGVGVALEAILDEHKHYSIAPLIEFRPIHALAFSFAPGITFEESLSGESRFSTHFEATYEFEVGPLHLGPLLEYALSAEDQHMMLGLHVGVAF